MTETAMVKTGKHKRRSRTYRAEKAVETRFLCLKRYVHERNCETVHKLAIVTFNSKVNTEALRQQQFRHIHKNAMITRTNNLVW